MTDDELKVTKSARKMTDMMTANNNIFRGNGKAIEFKNALLEDLTVLETAGADGISSRGQKLNATADKTSAENALEKFLRKIASTAKLIKKAKPEFNNTFVMRRGGYGSQELLDTARAFKDDLTVENVGRMLRFYKKLIERIN